MCEGAASYVRVGSITSYMDTLSCKVVYRQGGTYSCSAAGILAQEAAPGPGCFLHHKAERMRSCNRHHASDPPPPRGTLTLVLAAGFPAQKVALPDP
jgi:hypothetical protein